MVPSITRDAVTAIVVTRRSGERLDEVLEKLTQQTVAVDTIIIADATGGELLVPGGYRIVPVHGGVGDAVTTVLADDESALLWVLRDDVVPQPTALAALRAVLDASPSVAVVGPKQMDAERPAFIREFGESMSRSGIAVPLAEHELDQAQYDRASDVLAVGEAGMLVRRTVWDQVGGFDPALAAADAALDFGLRVRALGWRIEVVPNASVTVSHTATEAYLGDVADSRIAREEAKALTHRRLVHGSRALLPLHALLLVVSATMLTLGRLVRKSPHAIARWGGVLRAVFSPSDIVRAQRQRGRAALRRSALARLVVPAADMRRRRAMERDSDRARLESGDVAPRLPFVPAGLWLTALALAIGSVLQSPWFGATALAGGGLRPLSPTLGDLWASVGATQSPLFADVQGAPDGFTAVLALIGSLTWWDPNIALVGLLVLAVPLAFVAAWVGAGALVTKPGVAVLIAGTWALLPTVHTAISEGRVAAVIAHIVLPLVFRSLWGTSAVARGWLALTVAVVWVSAPVLAPFLLAAVVARVFMRPASPRHLVTLVPALALEWPRIIEAATSASPLSYFADRGIPVVGQAPDSLGLLALWPVAPNLPFLDAQLSVWVALAIAGLCAALSLVAVIVTGSSRVAALIVAGSVAVFAAAQVSQWQPARVGEATAGLFTGSLLDIAWWAILCGSAVAIARLPRLRAVTAGLVAGIVVVSAVAPATAVLMGRTPVVVSPSRTLPAYIEAETARNAQGGTLVITPIEGGYRAQLERGAGNTLNSWTASVVTRHTESTSERALAELTANLVVESGFDAAGALAAAGIDFVVLNASPHDNAVSAINSHAALAAVGSTDSGVLWAVEGDSATAEYVPTTHWAWVAGVAGSAAVALIAGIPTSLPRRRHVDDELPITVEEGDDES